jgi:hypothetical protein
MSMMPSAQDALLMGAGAGVGVGAALGRGLLNMFSGGMRRATEFGEFL